MPQQPVNRPTRIDSPPAAFATVRVALPSDIDAVQRVATRTWHATYADLFAPAAIDAFLRHAYSDYALRRTMNACGLWVLDRAGEVVGYTRLGVQGAVGTLGALYVLPDHQRRGYGRELWRCARSWYEARSVREVELTVAETNHRARAFYRRLGFSEGSPQRATFVGQPYLELACRLDLGV